VIQAITVQNSVLKLKKNDPDIIGTMQKLMDLLVPEASDLVLRNFIFNEFMNDLSKVQGFPLDNVFIETLKYNHFNTQINCINKFIDNTPGSASLFILIDFLRNNPRIITAEKYALLQHKSRPVLSDIGMQDILKKEFAELFGVVGLDSDKLKDDNAKLTAIKNKFANPRNKRTAHIEFNLDYHFSIKQSELTEAIKDIEILTCKYYQLVSGIYFAEQELLPVITYDWKRVYSKIGHLLPDKKV